MTIRMMLKIERERKERKMANLPNNSTTNQAIISAGGAIHSSTFFFLL